MVLRVYDKNKIEMTIKFKHTQNNLMHRKKKGMLSYKNKILIRYSQQYIHFMLSITHARCVFAYSILINNRFIMW